MASYAGVSDPYEVLPVAQAEESARVTYLRQVAMLTLGSLVITAVSAVVWMYMIGMFPEVLTQTYVAMGIMLGGIYGAQFLGNNMVASQSQGTRITGFVLGSSLSGIALSYVVGAAAILGAEVFGDPLRLIVQAGGLVAMTVLGMVIYLMTGPRNLSTLGSILGVLWLPMLGLMAVTWLFPVGGTMGLVFSAIFVAVSAGGLLYSLNQVMHQYSTDMVMAGAFHISTSIVVLFWNILTLLMRLTSRD